MSQYHRRRGDRVSYSPQQTQRYFSQLRRYAQGLQIRPSRQEAVGQNQIYYFRSDRAPAGEWRVIYNPDAEGDGDLGFPGEAGSFGALTLDCSSVPCLNDLQYVTATKQQFAQIWTQTTNPDNSKWLVAVNPPSTFTTIFRFPWSTDFPSGALLSLEDNPCSCSGACQRCQMPPTEEIFTGIRQGYEYEYRDQSFFVCSEGASWYIGGVRNGGNSYIPPEDTWIDSTDPDSGWFSESGVAPSLEWRSQAITFTYHYGSGEPYTTSTCSWGFGGGSGGNPGNEAAWRCNCPDQTQKQGTLSRSPWQSERQSRSWSGSNTHTATDGPCKHIYAAAFAAGQPFARPAGGNYWDYERAPALLNLDDTVGPDDWSEQDYLDWRERSRQRRENTNRFQRAAQQGQRQAERQTLQAEFERLGIADRSVPRNRYLQRQLRELSREAQANPQAQDRLDNFYLDLEFGE